MRSQRVFLAGVVAVVLLFTARPATAAETLAALRDDVRTPPSNQDDSDSQPRSRSDDNCSDNGAGWWDSDGADDSSDSDNGWLALVGLGLTSPFWLPHCAVGDRLGDPGYFAHFPYQYDIGYMLIDPVEALGIDGPRHPHWWAARTRGEFGTGFDGLDWIGGRVQLDTKSRFGIESDVRYVYEDLAAGRRDSLWLGDANLLFRFAQNEFVQFRTGLGFNYLADSAESDFGFNFTYAVDCQPLRPLVFSSELDLGTLGHASVVHVRTTAGLAWGVSEAYVGYDLYDIGATQIQGFVAGVQLWY